MSNIKNKITKLMEQTIEQRLIQVEEVITKIEQVLAELQKNTNL